MGHGMPKLANLQSCSPSSPTHARKYMWWSSTQWECFAGAGAKNVVLQGLCLGSCSFIFSRTLYTRVRVCG